MKNTLPAILALTFTVNSAFGQVTYQAPSECSNYNAFAKTEQIEQIRPLVGSILTNGALYLNQDKSDSLDFVFERMDLDNGTTFEFVRETQSRLDSTKFFRKYQQYYNSVPVDGGGYTIAYIGPHGPTDPCAEA
jgi:hypothetical protein